MLKPMFNTDDELNFLLNSLQPHDIALEWGSGGSTLAIAPKVKELYTIEHLPEWYYKVKEQKPDNCNLYLITRNQEEAPGHDGTLADFKDYVYFPATLDKKFDKIIIDGRARVECAKEAVKLLKPDGCIFIHDYRNPNEKYRRYEYELIEQFLQIEGFEYAMYKFTPKSAMQEILSNAEEMKEVNQSVEKTEMRSESIAVPLIPDVDACWHKDYIINEMNHFYDAFSKNLEIGRHFIAFQKLLLITDEQGNDLLDLGCGTAITSEYCKDFKYTGADLPAIIKGCAMRNYPDYFYRSCNIETGDLAWIRQYPVVVTSGVIDIMQYPLQVLENILINTSKYIIIHRQEITEQGATRSIQKPSYGGYTWHSIINRGDFLQLIDRLHFDIVREEKLNFGDWENGGCSFLLRKRKSWALNEMDHKLYKYFAGKENGIFVEAGANDGLTQSNTMYFEFYKNWRGILIEPIGQLIEKCINNRSTKNLFFKYALSDSDDQPVEIVYTLGNSGLLSMINDEKAPELLKRIQNEPRELVEGHTSSFNALWQKTNNTSSGIPGFSKIDLMILDIEGHELKALKGIDFDKIQIDYLLIEELEDNDYIKEYLAVWYDRVDKLSHHDWLYRSKKLDINYGT